MNKGKDYYKKLNLYCKMRLAGTIFYATAEPFNSRKFRKSGQRSNNRPYIKVKEK